MRAPSPLGRFWVRYRSPVCAPKGRNVTAPSYKRVDSPQSGRGGGEEKTIQLFGTVNHLETRVDEDERQNHADDKAEKRSPQNDGFIGFSEWRDA